MNKLIGLIFLLLSPALFSATFPAGTEYSVCFTPAQNCTKEIVTQINAAKKYINVQAYSFTSKPIARALVKAYVRGIKVKVILDKSNFTPGMRSQASYLLAHHIPIWNDYKLNIAHNKVMIFDGQTVETGSFNFTTSAQYYNAENVLIIHNKALADRYLANWFSRQAAAKPVK